MSDKPIIGLAGFGLEGRAAYEYFKGRAAIHIFDDEPKDITGLEATFHLGLTIPAYIQTVYKTPGIPDHRLVCESKDTKVSTLMDVVMEKVGSRTIGVTGTKGKSTVSSLCAHILKEAGKEAVLFGNIGVADMQLIESDTPERFYVLELSSYQCEHLTHSPHVAVLTNFYPEHLTHHGSLDRYREAKLNLARFQTANDVFINGSDIETIFSGKVVRPVVVKPFETKLLGAHNQRNCAIAVAAVAAFGVSEDEARTHIATFSPLPYRLEKVGTYKGVTFYDDSLATIPQATLASLAALGAVDTLIVGGEDRGIPFEECAKAFGESSVRTFITFPDTGAKMVTEVKGQTVVPAHSMEEAVRAAYAHTQNGGVVLLSNASPSFNMFKDYKDKSAQYRAWIEKLAA